MMIIGRTRAPASLSITAEPSWWVDASVDVSGDPVVRAGVTNRPRTAITAILTIRLRTNVDL